MSLDQYWSEEPNYTVERGMTVPRLHELAALVQTTRRAELYELGTVIAAAVNDPQQLRKLNRPPPRRIDTSQLGALAPVKRKRNPDG